MKKFVTFMLAATLVFGMAACGKKAETNTNTSSNTPETTQTTPETKTETEAPVESTEPAKTEEPADTTPVESTEATGKYKDGTYYAEQADFDEKSGYKDNITIVVSGGAITEVNWNSVHKDGGEDKKTRSENGSYGMVAYGNSQSEWHEQAILMENKLIETQDVTAIAVDAAGNTDAVAGVSITVDGFTVLAAEALKDALNTGAATTEPAGSTAGSTDGTYYAEQADFDPNSGYKSNVTLTVSNGKITAAIWDATHKDGGDPKRIRSKDGSYGMTAYSSAQSEWVYQAEKMEAELIKVQDPSKIAFGADGHTDAVAGVSITVDDFQALAAEAYAKVGSGNTLSATGSYKDGVYYAEDAEFNANSGWKENVTITVQGGKITDVNWNAVYKDGGDDKKTQSLTGAYGMTKAGAQAEWFDQAGKMEAELMRTQDVTKIAVLDNGKTDAVAGVSITVGEFTSLVAEALAGAK